ncbi:hypothetical protein Y1Q_0022368 [Alligator mississippiensis]|uniref:RING finger protein 145 n=2 Tax=Alligator mississippiensis TaxID=8496 RepID=A0A151NGA2_ALLMI|nr:hypothetical protein Y1Q_0022368 [Alligator mississippiensis]
MARLEAVANVALRVPGVVVLDLLYRGDAQAFAELLLPPQALGLLFHLGRHEDDKPRTPRKDERGSTWRDNKVTRTRELGPGQLAAPKGRGIGVSTGCPTTTWGHVLCAVVLLLPVQSLAKLYLHVLTLLLLYMGHQTARDYIQREMEYQFRGAVYQDPVALSRFITALTSQVIACALCCLLMRTRQPWLFSAPLLPLLARLSGLPLHALPMASIFAMALTTLQVLYVMASHILVPFRLAAAACREVAQVLEPYQLMVLGMGLWSRLAVPMLFLFFWLVLFALQLYSALASSGPPTQPGLIFIFLSSVAECCNTPYSLLGLTFTVSYLALGMLNLCKFYLGGFGGFQNGNVMHRGVTEGVILLLLALQTGVLDLQILQRTFLLSLILFIVVTSTLQSMIEITNPIVLALGASRNRSPWKHFRGITMCLFLLIFPCLMAYKVVCFFHMNFWLVILVSSCMLTSLQMMGTLFLYALFMIELLQEEPLERMDEVIYAVNAVSRVLEFLVAMCVVGYGTWELLFGEWSWVGASVIIVDSYFNIWLRAQSGWKSFLLRHEAAKKISLLPRATQGQLQDHNDVCAICFQGMHMAVITPCGHFFHDSCLRKWLYVQDTCPMCHQQVKPPATQDPPPDHPEQDSGAEEAAAPPPGQGKGDDQATASPAPGAGQAAEGTESCWLEQREPVPAKLGAGHQLMDQAGSRITSPRQGSTPQPDARAVMSGPDHFREPSPVPPEAMSSGAETSEQSTDSSLKSPASCDHKARDSVGSDAPS